MILPSRVRNWIKKMCHNKPKTESNSVRLSYLVINNQLSTNFLNVTASSNQEWDPFANDLKERGSKSSLGTISLNCSRCCCLGWPVFVPSDPPVPLLVGRLTSSASCWIITVGRLIVKCCSSPFPTMGASFEVELACFRRQKKNWGDIYNMPQPYNISPTDWGYKLSSTKMKPFKVWTILSTVIQAILRQN